MMRSWLLISVVVLAGCLGPTAEFRTVAYYDLVAPAPAAGKVQPLPKSLQVIPFAMLGPFRTKMIRRVGPQQLVAEEYDRWAEPPESLVTRQFYLGAKASGRWAEVVAPYGRSADYRLSGNVLAFERTADNQAHCQVEVTLEAQDGRLVFNRTFDASVAADGPTAAALAAAMSKAVDEVVAKALGDAVAAAK